MIRMRMDFFRETLGMGTSAVVLYPQRAAGQIGMEAAVGASGGSSEGSGDGSAEGLSRGSDRGSADRGGVPVLYLLHGLSDDCTIWERRTSIERYASEYGIAVVMPEVRRSFYINEALGERYWDFVSEELPRLVAATFRIFTRREDTYVAGLSMGGFGAMKLALHHPHRFAAAGSFSGALDLAARDLSQFSSNIPERLWGAGVNASAPYGASSPTAPRGSGAGIVPPEDNLVALAAKAEPAAMPRLWIGCGTADHLVNDNRTFLHTLTERGIEHHEVWTEGAGHEWSLWDEYVREFLAWAVPPAA